MRNIFILIQNYLRCSIGSMMGKKKARKGSAGIGIIFLLFVGLGLLIAFQATSFALLIKESTAEAAAEAGVTLIPDYKLLMYMGLTVGLVLVLFFSMQNITGGARANDADLLLSMPLKKIQIVTAKALSKYLIYFCMNFLFSAGFFIVYLIFAGFSFKVLAACLLIWLLVPALAIGLNYFLDYLTTVLFGRFTFASIFRTIFSLLVMCAFLGIWMYIQLGLNPAIGAEKLVLFPPISWLLDFALKFDLLALLWISLITILPLVLGIVLMATTFDKHNTAARRRAVNISAQKGRSPLMNVFLKEMKVYFNTPIWMINTLVGVLLMIAIGTWVAVEGGGVLAGLTELMGAPLGFGIAVAFCLLCSLVCTSCSTISLEGRSFWIIKTMPINTRQLLIGKTLLDMLLVIPVILVMSIVLGIVLKLALLEFLLLALLPICVNISIAFGGLFINLNYPKFDWDTAQQVVKQSMSVIMTMLMGMAVAIVPILAALIIGFSNMLLLALVCIGLLGALAVGTVVLTLTKGVRIFESL